MLCFHWATDASLMLGISNVAAFLGRVGGGVVRVESTNLSWVENAFAEHYSNHSLRLLRAGGVQSEDPRLQRVAARLQLQARFRAGRQSRLDL